MQFKSMSSGLCFQCSVCSYESQRGKRYTKKDAAARKGLTKNGLTKAVRKPPPSTCGRYIGPGPYGSRPRERARVAEDIKIAARSNDSTTYRASGGSATFVVSNNLLASRFSGTLSNAPLYVLDTILKCKGDGEYTIMEPDGDRYQVGRDSGSMKRGGNRPRFIVQKGR